MRTRLVAIALTSGALLGPPASAQTAAPVKVGVILATTGPAAALGTFEKNGVQLADGLSKQKLTYVFVDEASDPTQAARLAQRLITEDKVDVIIGPSITPSTLAITSIAAEAMTAAITQAPSNVLVQPADGPRRWIFKTSTNDEHEARPLFADMKKARVRTLGFIGFTDSYGEQWLKLTKQLAAGNQTDVVAEERYARTDTSVASQVLKITARSPDAVLVAASGAPAAAPILELRKRGYTGRIYVTLGATSGDFHRIAGADAEGLYAPFAAVMGVSQVPDGDAAKAGAQEFVQNYDGKYGAGASNIFAAGGWDSVKLIEQAIPVASRKGSPGTPEFRSALRDALEATKDYVGARGVYNMTVADHTGLDPKALVLGRYEKGRWVLQN